MGLAALSALLAAVSLPSSARGASACPVGSSVYGQAVAGTAGLVSYWRLGESSGAVACDGAGTNSGSYQPGTTLAQPGALAGDANTAVGFNGSTGFVSVSASSSLNVGDRFTIEAWVKRARTGSTEVIAAKQYGSWVLMFNGSNLLTLRRSSVADVASSTIAIKDTSQWHHVAATKDGTSVHLYIDGTDVTGPVANQTMVDNTQPLVIGQSSSASYLAGLIDEVALYNVALTPAQITSHYNAAIKPSGDPVIAAAGDIACETDDPNYNAGVGTTAGCQELATSSLMNGYMVAGASLAGILTLGDDQYESGSYSQFLQSYGPTWGRFTNITHPTPGNHEYYTNGASGYFDYFDGVGVATGIAGDRSQGYYSYDLGSWHLIALNSNCAAIGGCGIGSAEERWLLSDLAAHSAARCTLAYWHHPLFTSGPETGGAAMQQIFTDLYSANADLVLNGHEHQYERFGPQNQSGAADPTRGIREFVVGTGGLNLFGFNTIAANSEVRNSNTYGILSLTLHPTSYDWKFVPVAGGSFTDSGSSSCH
jgi:acid phosphatase type 7